MNIRALTLGFVFIVASQPLHAQCVSKRFRIIISAFDGTTQLGVPDAIVTLFANDDPVAWLAEYSSTAPLVTDSKGAVSGTFYFDTASSTFIGMDLCRRKLKKLEVVVTHEGYFSGRVLVKAANAVTSSTSTEVTVRVQAVMLLPLK